MPSSETEAVKSSGYPLPVQFAHRLATIEQADQILVTDHGRIVQKGTHSQLICQEGLYSRFVNIRKQAEGWNLS